VTGKEAPPHNIKTLFTRRVGGSWSGGDDGENGAGVQLEWSGSGSVDGTQERILSFLLRRLGLEDDTIFGQENWFYVDGRALAVTTQPAPCLAGLCGVLPESGPRLSGCRLCSAGEALEPACLVSL
jgi:hypothetical protein